MILDLWPDSDDKSEIIQAVALPAWPDAPESPHPAWDFLRETLGHVDDPDH